MTLGSQAAPGRAGVGVGDDDVPRLRGRDTDLASRTGGQPRVERVCSVEGCDRRHYGRGLCSKHWDKQRYHADPSPYIAANRRSRTHACVRCGRIGYPELRRDQDYTCYRCKAEARWLPWTCAFCERTFRDSPSIAATAKACFECWGIYTQAGKRLGLTRQRIHQIANKYHQQYGISRRAAVDMLLRMRGEG